MKKFAAALSIALCCLLLSACAQNAQASVEPVSDTASLPQQNAPAIKMTMALHSLGLLGTEIAGNENGAYYILSDTQDYSARILYYDYATRQLTYLSNQVIVTNDEENPGWLEDVFGGAVPLAVNEKLYIVKYGKPAIPSIPYEGSPSFLLQMEPNAANRQALAIPQGNLLKNNTGIAADGESLYVLLTSYDEAAMEITDVTLCKTDFSRKTFDRLLSFGVEKDTYIIGVYPGGIILQQTALPTQYAYADKQVQMAHVVNELQLYSIAENKILHTDFTWTQGELSFVLGQGVVYYVKNGTAQLCAYDLQNQTEQVIKENLLDGLPVEDADVQIRLMGSFIDNHICFKLQAGEERLDYSYSLQTQKALPLSLYFEYEGGTIPVSIAAESEECFLVNTGFHMLNRTATGTDGTPYSFASKMTEYALIQKEDYWNSIPNYIFFDDALLDSVA